MPDLLLRILLVVGVALVAVVLLLVEIFPYHPNSLLGWILFVILSLPIIAAGQLIGDKLLGAPFVAMLPRFLRIAYAVVALGGALAALMFAGPLLEPHLSKWGG